MDSAEPVDIHDMDSRMREKSEDVWITGKISTQAGEIPVVDSELRLSDRLGSFKARWGIGRMKYRVSPGLYAVSRDGIHGVRNGQLQDEF
jgi:hypothetical protein